MKALGVPIYTYNAAMDTPYFTSSGLGAPPAGALKRNITSSVRGLAVSASPEFTTESQPNAKPLRPLALADAQEKLSAETDAVKKSLLNNSRLASTPTAALIAEYRANEPKVVADPRPARPSYFDGGYGSAATLGTPSVRTLAEITARPKTPEVQDFLLNEFKNGSNSSIKSIALTGLATMAPADLKPLIVQALKAGDDPMLSTTAGFMALKFKDDPTVLEAMKANTNASTLLQRFSSGNFCSKESYDK